MDNHFRIFERVCPHPDMYVMGGTYVGVVAYIDGYVAGCGRNALAGFHEWVFRKLGWKHGRNLAWEFLLLFLAFPKSRDPRLAARASPKNQQKAIDMLRLLLEEFNAARGTAAWRSCLSFETKDRRKWSSSRRNRLRKE